MGKGLLAQWRTSIAKRGIAGAVLLAVPVAVAATIGLSGGFTAVGNLPALALEAPPQSDPPRRGGEVDVTILSSAAAPAPADRAPAGGGGASTGGGGEEGTGGGGGGQGGGGETGGGGGTTGGSIALPDVELPSDGAGPDPVGSLVDDLNQTVDGVLPGQ